jgi:hypothetical protein
VIARLRRANREQRKLLFSVGTNFLTRIPGAVGLLWLLPLLRFGLGTDDYANLLASMALASAAAFQPGGFNLIGRRLIGEAYSNSDRAGEADAFPSRPGNARATEHNGGDGRRGATQSHAQRALKREHGEAGEHRTFSRVSTVHTHHTPEMRSSGQLNGYDNDTSLQNPGDNFLDTHRPLIVDGVGGRGGSGARCCGELRCRSTERDQCLCAGSRAVDNSRSVLERRALPPAIGNACRTIAAMVPRLPNRRSPGYDLSLLLWRAMRFCCGNI